MSLSTTMIMALFFFQIITSFLLITTTTSSPHGFTIDLIQRRTNTSSSRLLSNTDGSSPYADTIYQNFDYLMKLQIGTPPVEIEAVLDTGSDVIWTQCLPCVHCYNQEAPIYDPSKSSTYKEKGPYHIIYEDQSYSKGNLATETVTLQSTSGQPFVMPETIIGCGHNNSGTVSPKSSGVIGLNWGALSLISQMGDDSLGLFSYCFAGKEGTSKINFGGNAIVTGGTVATNMFRKKDKPNFYYLNLDAISVGENRIETVGTEFHSMEGNIIIDSGTSNTYLPNPYCNRVKDAVESLVNGKRTSFTGENLCYETDNIEIFPVITMHFLGGADLVLEKRNMFVDDMGGNFCLGISCGYPSEHAIFGNIAQNNWLVGYDTTSQLVSFKSTDCSALWS